MRSLGVSSLYTWQSVHIVCRGVAVGAHRLQGCGSGCTSFVGAWQWVHIVCRGVAVGAHRLQGRGSGCTSSAGA